LFLSPAEDDKNQNLEKGKQEEHAVEMVDSTSPT